MRRVAAAGGYKPAARSLRPTTLSRPHSPPRADRRRTTATAKFYPADVLRVVTARPNFAGDAPKLPSAKAPLLPEACFIIVEAQRPLFIARKDQALSYSRWPSAGLQPLATVLLTMVTDVL
ncbi:hypothetical protein EVAR_99912_1 [Eumeta japonica]|uniref:Uncharacterized protein n=1 Tax=Eumeta variegata TaxID=151549 RepID=A0A4C2A4K3_EUMVA|nr:hypothetical protein EVAR_99912_1 [Eumeta japonica]